MLCNISLKTNMNKHMHIGINMHNTGNTINNNTDVVANACTHVPIDDIGIEKIPFNTMNNTTIIMIKIQIISTKCVYAQHIAQ